MTYRIYSLTDPRTGTIRYVGITVQSLTDRLGNHMRAARAGENTHKARWVRVLLAAGLRPTIALIEETTDPLRECHWISAHRSAGLDLVNTTTGGREGMRFAASVKAKLTGGRGRVFGMEARQRMSEAQRGHAVSPETRAKLRAAQTGKKRARPYPEDARRRIAAAKAGKSPSETTKAKISAALLGRAFNRHAHTTHCPRGHAYTPENTFVNVRGARECQVCRTERFRAAYERRRLQRGTALRREP